MVEDRGERLREPSGNAERGSSLAVRRDRQIVHAPFLQPSAPPRRSLGVAKLLVSSRESRG